MCLITSHPQSINQLKTYQSVVKKSLEFNGGIYLEVSRQVNKIAPLFKKWLLNTEYSFLAKKYIYNIKLHRKTYFQSPKYIFFKYLDEMRTEKYTK